MQYLTTPQLMRICLLMISDWGLTVEDVARELQSEDCPKHPELQEIKAWLKRIKAKYTK